VQCHPTLPPHLHNQPHLQLLYYGLASFNCHMDSCISDCIYISIFQCGTHPAAAWTNREKLQKYCYDTSKATTTRALTNVIMDLIIVVSPMPIVWRMKMTMVRKLQVTAIFATGFMYDLIACLFSLTDTWQSSRCRHSQSIYSTPGLTRFKCAWISRSSR
jgi:hypothetical protein